MTGMDDTAVQARFAAIAETIDDSDWGDVVVRAGVATNHATHRALRRRATLVALGAALALGVVVAAVLGLSLHTDTAASMPGPKRIERRVPNGTIAWLFHHDQRGQSLANAHIAIGSTVGAHWQPVRFARVLTPDRASKAKVVVSLIGKRGRNICMTVFLPKSGIGGCAIGLLLKPFSEMTGSGIDIAGVGGGVILAGLASDAVARMEVFLPHGRHRPVPLEDNAFFVSVRATDLPANLVAYDKNGLIIGTNGTTRPRRLR